MAIPDDSATEVLPAAPVPVATGSGVLPKGAADGSLIGRTLGKFAVVEKLGRGGSGDVYRAEQPQLGRSAVIKVLRRELAATSHRTERFLREAKLASRLDHPYAAHIYAFGVEPDGVLWIAMEYVRGVTLDELVIRRGAFPATVFGPLFARLCEVVHTAHELGIVHRDIKGSNVMVIERAGQLLPKLLDFGIAKGLEPEPLVEGTPNPEPDASLTGDGATLGSPHYMAPEQWQSPAGVDAKADIYALGVLAYRCVSGALPFAGIERSRLASAHLNMSAPPLPDIVDAPIAAVVMRALAKTPAARWPSALAFGEAMRAAIGGGVVEAVPIFEPATRERWVKSGPQPIADAVARVARATTTVEADAALRELVAITCRWLAVLGLSQHRAEAPDLDLRESARAVVGRDDAAPWLRLARVAASVRAPDPLTPPKRDSARLLALQAKIDSYSEELTTALNATSLLEELATRLDAREGPRTAAALATDIVAMADALVPLEPLLSYQLVVGRGPGAESWQGARRRDRERVVLWGEPLVDGEVALLDATGRTVAQLSPLVQVTSPLPSAEPELFLLWRSGKGNARLVAAPWGFERDDDAAAIRLAVLTTEDSETANDANDDRSPYPGLAAYGVADAGRFVGREREVESLANRLVRAPMVAVLGPSGAGKSSFIHAGLLPRLAESYEIITMRPGRHPLHVLAALPPLNVDGPTPEAIAARLQTLGDRAPRGIVVVIDQLEEVVTLCTDPREREAFAKTLALAAATRDTPVRIVVTLRDDFASLIESLEGFRGRFEAFILATPPPEALRRIVTEPARRANVTVETKVVDEMVAEVAGRPASLPLLSFTAAQLWQKRDRAHRRITHDAYLELGGVQGALSTYADHVYTSLARRDQDIVRDLFSRLVARDGTRIPAPRDELERIRGATSVLAHLIDARLLVVREDEDAENAPSVDVPAGSAGRTTTPSHDLVEIVHECLATRWDRLARWRNEDAADRALLGDVRVAARRWQDSKRRPDLLWHGEAQLELRKLAVRSTALTDGEREFARAGDAAERRARRLRRAGVVVVISVLGVVAIVMAYLGLAANRSRGQAEHSAVAAKDAARLAEDRLTQSMVAQGRRELSDGRALSALAYLGEAMRRGADTTAIRTMVALANRAWPYVRHQEQGDLTVFATTSDSFVLADAAGTMRWVDAHGKTTGELATANTYISDLTVSDGKIVGPGNEGIVIVDATKHTLLALVKPATRARMAHLGPGRDELTAVEDAGLVVYGLDGKEHRRYDWDAIEGEQPMFDPTGRYVILEKDLVVTHVDLVAMKMTPLATAVLTGPMEQIDGPITGYLAKGTIAHVLAPNGTELRTFHPTNTPSMLAFSKDGDRIAAISDHDVAIFDAMGQPLYSMAVYTKGVLVRMRGDDTWITAADGVIRHFHKGVIIASLPVQETDLWASGLVGDALGVISSSSNFVVVDAMAQQVIPDPPPCRDDENHSDAFGAEGRTMTYLCGDQQFVYVGRKKIATMTDSAFGLAAYDEASHRLAIAAKELTVFDDSGAIVKQTEGITPDLAGVVFRDADHVLVMNPTRGKGLWEWTLSTDGWAHISDAPNALGLEMLHGDIVYGTDKGDVVLLHGTQEVKRVHVGDRVDYLVTSPDQKWLAVMLTTGTGVVLDGSTFDVVRELPHADSGSYSTQFDAHGDLLVRFARGALVVTDRQTGEDIISNLDLLKSAVTAHFLPDGRMELGGPTTALLDIPRDDRPVEQILRDVACRVPLKVVDGRLEPTETVCAPDLQR